MIYRKIGKVISLEVINNKIWEVFVNVDNYGVEKAIVFPDITGEVSNGDEVLLNTTAIDLGLGSGGYHFVMANLSSQIKENLYNSNGHIMKMRYTPMQMKVLSVEEKYSHYHELIKMTDGLEEIPVISGSLHSMLVPCVCGIKAENKSLRIAYLMTDGGALPLALSKAVKNLESIGYLCGTVTVGNAYGGDIEAVNLYSGLIAAKKVFKADIIVVLMGPGIVGTGTRWGHTGLEVGQIINAVCSLNGNSFTIPRISFAEYRERHRGISHHTLTALERVALSKTIIVLPKMSNEQKKVVQKQLDKVLSKHKLIWGQGEKGVELAIDKGLPLYHMGRSINEDIVFFLAASAVGEYVAQYID